MDHPEGAGLQRADRVDFDPRVRLEFNGTQLSSDGGLLVMREVDDALGLSDLAATALRDTRCGKNTIHRLNGLFRQSVFGRLAGYEDVNDAMISMRNITIRTAKSARYLGNVGLNAHKSFKSLNLIKPKGKNCNRSMAAPEVCTNFAT